MIDGFWFARQDVRNEAGPDTLDDIWNPVVCLVVRRVGIGEDASFLSRRSMAWKPTAAETTHGIDSDHHTLGIVFLLQRARDTSDGPTGPSTSNKYVYLSGRRA